MSSNDTSNNDFKEIESNVENTSNDYYLSCNLSPGFYRHPNRVMNLENTNVTLHRTLDRQGRETVIALTPDGEPIGFLTDRDVKKCLPLLQYVESAIVCYPYSDTKGHKANISVWVVYNLALTPQKVETLPREYISEYFRQHQSLIDKEETKLRKSRKFADYWKEVREQERIDCEPEDEFEIYLRESDRRDYWDYDSDYKWNYKDDDYEWDFDDDDEDDDYEWDYDEDEEDEDDIDDGDEDDNEWDFDD